MTEPDPNWRYVDHHGHGHFLQDDAFPTLTWVVEPCTLGHDDCTSEGHYECSECHETIQPRYRGGTPRQIPGLTSVTVVVEDVARMTTTTYQCDEREWLKVLDAMTAVITHELKDHVTGVERRTR